MYSDFRMTLEFSVSEDSHSRLIALMQGIAQAKSVQVEKPLERKMENLDRKVLYHITGQITAIGQLLQTVEAYRQVVEFDLACDIPRQALRFVT